jgi:hypothetical protein
MNIALVLQHKLLLGIQRFMQSGTGTLQKAPQHAIPDAYMQNADARTSAAGSVHKQQAVRKAVPLRVLRIVESGMTGNSSGRLVISGRMADVCAELDRLVEREATLH